MPSQEVFSYLVLGVMSLFIAGVVILVFRQAVMAHRRALAKQAAKQNRGRLDDFDA